MRQVHILMLLVALLAGCATPTRYTVHEKPWLQVRTENFTIWTSLPEPRARRLADNLELFRRICEFIIGGTLPSSRLPTRVYAFSARDEYLPFGSAGALAYFRKTLRGSELVTYGTSTAAMHHEYVHYLTFYHEGLAYPKWYSEGFAEFLGSADMRGSTVEIGKTPDRGPPFFKLPRGRQMWAPIVDVMSEGVAGQHSHKLYQLYNQAWALVHYLYFGRSESGQTRAQLGRYFAATQSGTSVRDATESAFGVTVEQLDERLKEYVRAGRYRYVTRKKSEFGEIPPPEVSTLSQVEVALALGELAMKLSYVRTARAYFESARELAPNSARARYALAGVLATEGHEEEAVLEYEGALADAPDDALAHLEFANYLRWMAERAEEKKQDPGAIGEIARRARKHYLASWKLDDSIPETYAMYGATYLLEGQDAAKGMETLQHARDLDPANLVAMQLLAMAYLETEQPEEARRLALIVFGARHGGHGKPDEDLVKILEETGGVPASGDHED